MSAKIQLKSDLVGTFGGIFLMLDHFGKANLDKLINKSLGDRRFNAKYSYSDIFKTLLATYTTNGSCIEDSRRISGQISEKSQDYRLCSPDILLNSFKELCTESSALFSALLHSIRNLLRRTLSKAIGFLHPTLRVWG